MALSRTKQEHLVNLYTIAKRYPAKKTAVLSKLEDYGLTVDDFNEYDSLMVSQNVVEDPDPLTNKYPEVSGFTQSDKYSDDQILKIFESRDSLMNIIEDIGEPDTEAEWFKSGKDATARIEELRPFYETKKAEEWEGMTEGVQPLADIYGGALGALTQIGGIMDFRHDFKEDFHERGFLSSWNPLTLFGAFDLAEYRENPLTGRMGFTPELLAMENELEELYGERRRFDERLGQYSEALPGSGTMQEISELNEIITQEKLLDPRNFGEQ